MENRLSYLFGGQLMVVPKHMQRRRHQQSGPSQSYPHRRHPPPTPELEPSRTQPQSQGSSYHSELRNDSLTLEFQGYSYHPEMPNSSSNYQQLRSLMMADTFSSAPQYSTPPDQSFGTYHFLSCFDTPHGSSMDDENAGLAEKNIELSIDCREHPRRQ